MRKVVLASEEGTDGGAPLVWVLPCTPGVPEAPEHAVEEVAVSTGGDAVDALNLYQELLTRTNGLGRELRALTTVAPDTIIPPWLVILERLSVETQRAQRHSRPLSAVVVEVDDLVSLRDVKGDEAADEALAQLATHVRAGLRVSDECGRLAGGSFLIVCPETDAAGASVVASRIVGRGPRINVIICGVPVPLSVSVGAAVLTAGLDGAGLLVATFGALARAKRAGGGWSL